MKKRVFLFVAGFVCSVSLFSAQQKAAPYVIMISFDGFRFDYVKNFNPPNFNAFIQKGSQAEALIPSFPSKTFPNHYTLVTGLTPGHHGLVDNSFYDPQRRTIYGMRDKAKVVDPYYYGGIPLWQLAKQNGMKSASYFWVGSEMSDEKRRPDYYFQFKQEADPQLRINKALEWLRLPESERPHFITLYFPFPDHEGHDYGPRSQETRNAVLRADSLLGNLMDGLKSIKLPVNVIIVSDHGMRELTIKEETYIFLDQLVNRKDTSVIITNGGTGAHFYIRNKLKRDSVYSYLKSKEKYFKVYKKSEFPERWNYNVERSGDIMIEADENHYIRDGNWEELFRTAKPGSPFGVHGYDPEVVKDVRGIFYAQGPNIKRGLTIAPFQNIHVYPLLARILGLPIPVIDGKVEVLDKVYQK